MKDLHQLLERAKEQGFTVTHTANGHLRVVSPSGEKTHTAATPSDTRSLDNFRAQLRRIGYKEEATPRRTVRRQIKQQILQYLYANGGEIRDERGLVSSRIAAELDIDTQAVTRTLTHMRKTGEVVTETKGKRTYAVLMLQEDPPPASDNNTSISSPVSSLTREEIADALLNRVLASLDQPAREEELTQRMNELRDELRTVRDELRAKDRAYASLETSTQRQLKDKEDQLRTAQRNLRTVNRNIEHAQRENEQLRSRLRREGTRAIQDGMLQRQLNDMTRRRR